VTASPVPHRGHHQEAQPPTAEVVTTGAYSPCPPAVICASCRLQVTCSEASGFVRGQFVRLATDRDHYSQPERGICCSPVIGVVASRDDNRACVDNSCGYRGKQKH
jgi:hypothetical protein